jgi:malonyl-CoA O-methyltransferase
MIAPRRAAIAQAFSSAQAYDRHARVQRDIARQLAARIAMLPLGPNPRVLEFGCGTGFLTEALVDAQMGGEWLITDLSPAMAERCRARIGARWPCQFAALDAEYDRPKGDQRYDLICSSLAAQWFDDLAGALPHLIAQLAPGGHLIFTTLAQGSFAEWRAAHTAHGLAAGTPDYPSAAQLAALPPMHLRQPARVDCHIETHASARDFLRALKAIGAGTAAPTHQPINPAAMRRVMRHFEAGGAQVTYEVVTCHYRAGV